MAGYSEATGVAGAIDEGCAGMLEVGTGGVADGLVAGALDDDAGDDAEPPIEQVASIPLPRSGMTAARKRRR
jgi:hypothetical protein